MPVEPSLAPVVARLVVRVTGNVIDRGMVGAVLAGGAVRLHKASGQWLVTDAEVEPIGGARSGGWPR